MAKNINNPNQEKNEKVGEAVSQTEEFFKKNGKQSSISGQRTTTRLSTVTETPLDLPRLSMNTVPRPARQYISTPVFASSS